MKILILKFGGAAVATPEHFSKIADIIISRVKENHRIVVVVSAMGNTTNQLIDLAKQVHPQPPQREYDMLISVGERISMSLLAMALISKKQDAISFTGSQSGIITCSQHAEARIVEVRPYRLIPCLESGKVVIVAGFQGVSKLGEITTLGRGGSDTTAVALAAALKAEKVEFFKDVPGIFSDDPKKNPDAKLHTQLTYESAMQIVRQGAKVLHGRCIGLAQKNGIPLHVRSFTETSEGTLIREPDQPRQQTAIYE